MTPDELKAELARHHAAAFGWALHCCGRDRHQAEDVLNTSYVKVLEGRAVYGGRSSFRTWLLGVIRMSAREARRWTRLRSLLAGRTRDPALLPVPGESAETLHARGDTAARLIEALRGLPQRQRDVLHLVFYQDLSIADAAEALGIAVGTARTHYERGKAQLRLVLGDAVAP